MELIKIKQNSKRVGRGYGSGKGGHTAGRGTKGQKSRSGYTQPRPGFEGGSMPLSRRIPKLRGFSRDNIDTRETVIITLNVLDKAFKDDEVVNAKSILDKGLVKGTSKNFEIKILNNGEITKKLIVEGLKVSKSAIKKIEKAGGKIS
ncbi:50S ribosomal protein L15 [Candidatus Dojkabacteria bacterium]|nr:50S ribosomal protein L15 [Candidatus Dojkabacteria bacterium]